MLFRSILVAAQADRSVIEAVATGHEMVQKIAQGMPPKKVIVVPGRLVNVVI